MNISGCHHLSNEDLKYVFKNVHNLQKLLIKNHTLSLETLDFLGNLQDNLKYLDISCNLSKKTISFSEKFMNKFFSLEWKLNYLNIEGFPLSTNIIEILIRTNLFRKFLITLIVELNTLTPIHILTDYVKPYQSVIISEWPNHQKKTLNDFTAINLVLQNCIYQSDIVKFGKFLFLAIKYSFTDIIVFRII